jgi:hypothetical protein
MVPSMALAGASNPILFQLNPLMFCLVLVAAGACHCFKLLVAGSGCWLHVR